MTTVTRNYVVINTCYGGFGLSMAALRRLARWLNMSIDDVRERYLFAPKREVRHCPFLVRVVREMEHRSWGDCARLSIVEITGNQYRINEYDGLENIETPDTMLWTQVPLALPDAYHPSVDTVDDESFKVACDIMTGRLPMPNGEIACAQIDDAICEIMFGDDDDYFK
mgnify:CR=1 FL=1